MEADMIVETLREEMNALKGEELLFSKKKKECRIHESTAAQLTQLEQTRKKYNIIQNSVVVYYS